MNKQTIIENLSRWIKQRPGLDFANYGDISAYRRELRKITQDYHDARELLAFVAIRDSITAEDIITASERAFAGRLTINKETGDIDYCAGQYWPTEYRAAVCAVLTSVIGVWFRDKCEKDSADTIRKAARAEFGRDIASRWFKG